MPSPEIFINPKTLIKIKEYYQFLCDKGIEEAGQYFKKQLKTSKIKLKDMDLNTFTTLLIQSKIPKVFAEAGIFHDKRDWTIPEEQILGDISVEVPVTVYNNGGHYQSFKNLAPFSAYLFYVPGALLNTSKAITADMKEVVVEDKVDQNKFNALYERRLLSALVQINLRAGLVGKKATITIPGIGTGQFAAEIFSKDIKKNFRLALEHVLTKYKDLLPQIDVIQYDPYEGDVEKTEKIGHIDYRVRPSKTVTTTAQLEYPKGTSDKTHILVSLVAWDHFSWPGNDFWKALRSTDDGVKAASTDTMAVITGVQGTYNPKNGSYEPPAGKGFLDWEQVAKDKQVQFSGPIFVISPEGKKTSLKDYVEPGAKQILSETSSEKVESGKTHETYNTLSTEIDTLLNNFANKIDTIGTHHPNAKKIALELLKSLKNAKQGAFTNPNSAKLNAFNTKVSTDVNDAIPILQKDLGWGDYLSNLARQIVNAITTFLATIVTLGHSKHQGFFDIRPSEANKAAQDVSEDIQKSMK